MYIPHSLEPLVDHNHALSVTIIGFSRSYSQEAPNENGRESVITSEISVSIFVANRWISMGSLHAKVSNLER